MATGSGIRERLGRLFALQLVVIGFATVVGIYVTQLVVEDLLTRRALEAEAEHFWHNRANDPNFPIPFTANLRGYSAVGDAPFDAPGALANFAEGYHVTTFEGRNVLANVSRRGDERVLLVVEGDQISDLAFYFGVLPLSIALLVMYALLFVAFRWSQQAVSPLVQLADQLKAIDLKGPPPQLDLDGVRASADAEVVAMADALQQLINRLDEAIVRERNFTRDAGHELRTPVAVFKGSLDMLDKAPAGSPAAERALARMRRTVQDIEVLLESLLLLAREESAELEKERCDVGEMARSHIRSLGELVQSSGNKIEVEEEARLSISAPPRLLDVVALNLIRNALLYTDQGEVTVRVMADRFVVEDSGPGMSREQAERAFEPFYRVDASRTATKGHGLGLSIVRRVADLLGWTLSLDSEPGVGTAVTVQIPPADLAGNHDRPASR